MVLKTEQLQTCIVTYYIKISSPRKKKGEPQPLGPFHLQVPGYSQKEPSCLPIGECQGFPFWYSPILDSLGMNEERVTLITAFALWWWRSALQFYSKTFLHLD